ncbi:AMP-binding enzyme [Cooperia oncophora]
MMCSSTRSLTLHKWIDNFTFSSTAVQSYHAVTEQFNVIYSDEDKVDHPVSGTISSILKIPPENITIFCIGKPAWLVKIDRPEEAITSESDLTAITVEVLKLLLDLTQPIKSIEQIQYPVACFGALKFVAKVRDGVCNLSIYGPFGSRCCNWTDIRMESDEPAMEVSLLEQESSDDSPTIRCLAKIGINHDGIDRQETFTSMGLDSLQCAELEIALQSQFPQYNIPTGIAMRKPTVEEMDAYLMSCDVAYKINNKDVDAYSGHIPLSPQQRGLLFMSELEPHTRAQFNEPVVFTTSKENFNQSRFRKVLNSLAMRHTVLRTSYFANGQTVLSGTEAFFACGRSSIAPQNFVQLSIDVRNTSMNAMVWDSAGRTVVCLVFHHIAVDGHSINIITREIGALYSGERLPLPRRQYADYAIETASLNYEMKLAKWREHLKCREFQLLVTDKPRTAKRTYNGASIQKRIPATLQNSLKKLRQAANCTNFCIFAATYKFLVYKTYGISDFPIGFPSTLRTKEHTDTVGCFVNMVPLVELLDPSQTLAQYLSRISAAIAEAKSMDVPLDVLVSGLGIERDDNVSPLFQVLLVMDSVQLPSTESDISLLECPTRFAKYEQTWYFRNDGKSIYICVEYNSDLFRQQTIEDYMDRFLFILKTFQELPPHQMLKDIAITKHSELRSIYEKRRGNTFDIPEITVLEMFYRNLSTKSLIKYKKERMSYEELNDESSKMADSITSAYLSHYGELPSRDRCAAVFMERSLDLDMAYITCTSGTTGNPKLVCTEFSGHSNLAAAYTETFLLHNKSHAYQVVNYSFDIFFADLTKTFVNGASITLAEGLIPNIAEMDGVTNAYIMPAYLSSLSTSDIERLSFLESIHFGGEAIQPSALRLLLQTGVDIFHEHGVTEQTVFTMANRMHVNNPISEMGPPYRNLHCLLRDGDQQLLPERYPSIYYVNGCGLFRGYYGNEELNAKTLRKGIFGKEMRTGDVVKCEHGRLHFQGRNELQRWLLVSRCVGVLLSERLPSYCVPKHFAAPLKKFPLNQNGKIDKKLLPKPLRQTSITNSRPPQGELETVVADSFKKYTQRDFMADECFFDFGGDSVKAMLVVQDLAARGYKLELSTLFSLRTAEKIANHLGTKEQSRRGTSEMPNKDSCSFETPLSPQQKRLWFLAKMYPDRDSYMIRLQISFSGQVDVMRLRHSFNAVVIGHPALRSNLDISGNEPLSLAIIGEQLAAAYNGARIVTGHTLHEQEEDGSLDFWRTYLSDYEPLMIQAEGDVEAFDGEAGYIEVVLDFVKEHDMREVCSTYGCTPFQILVLCYVEALRAVQDTSDIVIGTTIANRTPENMDVVGLFANTIPLRFQEEFVGFPEHLSYIGRQVLSAMEHQSTPLAKIIEEVVVDRDATSPPLFRHVLTLLNASILELPKMTGIQSEVTELRSSFTQFDQSWIFHQGKELSLVIQYDKHRCSTALIKNLLDHFKFLLNRILKRKPIRLPVLSMTDLPTNDTPRCKSLGTIFDKQAALLPSGICLQSSSGNFSFENAVDASRNFAYEIEATILQHTAELPRADDVICLILPESIENHIAIESVHLLGCAYLCLSPDTPIERIQYILADCQAKLVVTHLTLRGISVPTLSPEPSFERKVCWWPRSCSTSLAYLIYTSGTTGTPKGVCVSHQSTLNMLKHATRLYNFRPGGRVLQFTKSSFDASISNTFGCLLNGGILSIRDENADVVQDLAKYQPITVLHMTPIVMEMFDEQDLNQLSDVEIWSYGGETISESTLSFMIDRGHRMVQLYGPTEVTCYQTSLKMRRGHSPTCIGHTIPGLQYGLCSFSNPIVQRKSVGQFFCTGENLARGYTSTADRGFTKNPFRTFEDRVLRRNHRMYLVGDRLKRDEKEYLHFLGRNDDQVKVKGHRVELSEIEAAARSVDGVTNAVAVIQKDRTGSNHIVLFYSGPAKEPLAVLGRQIPPAMLPSKVVQVAEFPLTLNHKIDRAKLSLGASFLSSSEDKEEPRDHVDQQVLNAYREVLQQHELDISSNFFQAGGHSLLVVQLVSALKKSLEVSVPIVKIFEFPRVRDLADWVRSVQNVLPENRVLNYLEDHGQPSPLQITLLRSFRNPKIQALYDISFTVALKKPLSARTCVKIVNQLSMIHPSLRTRFTRIGRGYSREVLSGTECFQNMDIKTDVGLNPLEKPPFLASFDGNSICIVVNHIIVDGHSMQIIVDSLAQILNRQKVTMDDGLMLHSWLRERFQNSKEDDVKYWKGLLKEYVYNQLPTTFPRLVVNSSEAGTLVLPGGQLTSKVQSWIQRYGCSPFVAVLTLLSRTLQQHSCDPQLPIAIGFPVNLRTQELQNSVGYGVNTVLVLQDTRGTPSEVLQMTPAAASVTKFELSVFVDPDADTIQYEYNRNLFDQEYISNLAQTFQNVICNWDYHISPKVNNPLHIGQVLYDPSDIKKLLAPLPVEDLRFSCSNGVGLHYSSDNQIDDGIRKALEKLPKPLRPQRIVFNYCQEIRKDAEIEEAYINDLLSAEAIPHVQAEGEVERLQFEFPEALADRWTKSSGASLFTVVLMILSNSIMSIFGLKVSTYDLESDEADDEEIMSMLPVISEFPLEIDLDKCLGGYRITIRTQQCLPKAALLSCSSQPLQSAECSGPDCLETVVRIALKVLGVETIDINENFFSAGGNSLQVIAFVEMLEESLNVNIEIAEVYEMKSFSEFANQLHSKISAAQGGECHEDSEAEMFMKPQTPPRIPKGITNVTSPQLAYRVFLLDLKRHEQRACITEPGGSGVSYAELARIMERQAASIRLSYCQVTGETLRNDTIIPIIGDSCGSTIITLLSILSAGAAYLPIDSTLPLERILLLLKESHTECYVGERIAEIPHCHLTTTSFAGRFSRLLSSSSQKDLAYVIYTSGTTGIPKGVCINHGAVMNMMRSSTSDFRLKPDDVIYQFTNFIYDNSVLEIFMTLANGAKLVVDTVAFSPRRFVDLMEQCAITHCLLFPGIVATFSQRHFRKLAALRYWIVGAEKLPQRMFDMAIEAGVSVIQNYGPTETTAYALTKHMRITDLSNNLGKAIRNTDSRVGETGELILRGKGIMRGYLGLARKDVLLEGSMVSNRRPAEGKVEGEVLDSCSKLLPNHMRPAHVLTLDEFPLTKNSKVDVALLSADWKRHLQKNRLNKLVQSFFGRTIKPQSSLVEDGGCTRHAIELGSLYMKKYGQTLDIAQLLERPLKDVGEKQTMLDKKARNSEKVKERLRKIWRKVLKHDTFGLADHFFFSGGNSISLIKLRYEINTEFQAQFTIRDLLNCLVFSEMSAMIESTGKSVRIATVVHNPPTPRCSLVFIHALYGGSAPYTNLIKCLSQMESFQIITVQHPNTFGFESDDVKFFESIESLAQRYAAEVAELLNGSSDTVLIGASLGGTIAVEMTNYLEVKCKVIVIDSGTEYQKLKGYSFEDHRKSVNDALVNYAIDDITKFWMVLNSWDMLIMLRDYEPTPPSRIEKLNVFSIDGSDLGWSRLVTTSTTRIVGTHADMLSEKYCHDLANEIVGVLSQN